MGILMMTKYMDIVKSIMNIMQQIQNSLILFFKEQSMFYNDVFK